MRIIIYGMGQLFKKYADKIEWNFVVAIADQQQMEEAAYHDVPVIKPQEIEKINYDFIAIFSNKLFEKIRVDLIGNYYIEECKIISWHEVLDKKTKCNIEFWQFVQHFLKSNHYHKILDIGMNFISKYFHVSQEISFDDIQIDGIGKLIYPIYKNLYTDIYEYKEICNKKYPVIFLGDQYQVVMDYTEFLQDKKSCILFFTPYLDENGKNYDIIINFLYGNSFMIQKYALTSGILWSIRKIEEINNEDIKIYVVTHKNYNVKKDCMYIPLCVGMQYHNEDFLDEKQGINVAHLNEKINECTGLYWIWKNTNSEYIGLNHYRRYFYNNSIMHSSNYLDKTRATELLNTYDIILPLTSPVGEGTVLEEIERSIDYKAFVNGYNLIRNGIKTYQPDYLETFDFVMNNYHYFCCNLFVTRRRILNEYCEWLFSFLLEAAESMDVSEYDNYSKRTIGFFAERMMTVWLMKQNLKIKELPFTHI